ncbi:hypothetical protein AVEN_104987-1, partial [Araneus ventricosus]
IPCLWMQDSVAPCARENAISTAYTSSGQMEESALEILGKPVGAPTDYHLSRRHEMWINTQISRTSDAECTQ